MESESPHTGDRRSDHAGISLHDCLGQLGPRGISARNESRTRACAIRIGRFPRNERAAVEGIVEARSTNPAEGVTPVHWRSLANHRVESFMQTRKNSQLLRRRQVIEKPSRTIKSMGFEIENVRLATEPFRSPCAMTQVAAVSSCSLCRIAIRQVDACSGTNSRWKIRPNSKLSPVRWKELPNNRKPGRAVTLRGSYHFRAIEPGYEIAGNA